MCHEDVGKCNCYLGTHHGIMGLEKIVSTVLGRIFLEYEAKRIFKVSGWDRRVAVVELFKFFAYCPNFFLLLYVCMKVCNIQGY